MRRSARDLWMKTFDVRAYGFVELDFVLVGERQQRGRGEHLRRRAQTKKHLGLHRRGCFDVGNAERFLIYDAVTTDDRDDGARRVLFLELFRHEFVEFAEVDRLGFDRCWNNKKSQAQGEK